MAKSNILILITVAVRLKGTESANANAFAHLISVMS